MKERRILITGGAGFIGSNLAKELAEENEVLILDDLSTGRMENIKELIRKKKVSFVNASIMNRGLKRILDNVDYVYHMAAMTSVPRSIKEPTRSNEVNITGTLNVLTAASGSGVKKVVYASSSSVYGDTPALPKTEDMPVNPMSPYAVTKATGEFYCKVFRDIYGLQTVSLRYFNVFGPGQDPNSQYAAVIPRFIDAIMNDKPPIIYGDGDQSRDFTFVKHVVNASIMACEHNVNGVFNIACGRQVTINQLVKTINEILGKDITQVYTHPRPGDIKHSLADISKARSFGYDPGSNLKDELKETIRWFNNAKTIV